MTRSAANYELAAVWDDGSCEYCWGYAAEQGCLQAKCQWIASQQRCDVPYDHDRTTC